MRLADAPRRPVPGRYSVTQLVSPPLIRQLTITYWERLEEDISDMLWRIFGKMGHAAMQGLASPNTLTEEKLVYVWDDVTIVQVIDHLENDILRDFKFTSVWSFLLGEKEEWEQQLNLYAFGLQHALDMMPKEMYIDAILRDWSKSKSLADKDYPSLPYISKPVSIWPKERQVEFLKWRIEELRDAENGSARPCTAAEMWERPSVWAVKKIGAKRAFRLFETKEEAESNCGNGMVIERRQGERVRCRHYCPVRAVCPFNKSMEAADVTE